jgi:hypothetical protein
MRSLVSVPVLVVVVGCAASDLDGMESYDDVAISIAAQEVEAIPACPTGQWCVEAAPVPSSTLLHDVWAVSRDDVFAVGDNGTILRRINNAWTAMPSATTRNLRGVWAASGTDAWAVGVNGTVVRWNGTAWSVLSGLTSSNLDAVWGSGPDDVWMVGGGTVLRWNGTGFTTFGFGGVLLAVSGTGPSDVWVTGENTNLKHFTGSGWTSVNPGAGTSTFFSVLALSTTDVWAANFNPGKETVHMSGTRWTPQRTSSGIFQGMAAFSATDLWAVGGSRVGHWSGSSWILGQPFGTSASLWSVATAPGHAWIVGSNALIAHRAF